MLELNTQTIHQSNNVFMKKLILAAVALLCLTGTAVAQRHIEYKWRGAYFVVDAGYNMNLNRGVGLNGRADTVAAVGVSFSGGFQFSKEAGLGMGATYISDPTGAFTQMPVYVELRSHFMRSRLTPYTVLQGGYSLPLGSSSEPPRVEITKGGLYFGVSVGARYAVERTFAIGLHVDYKMLQSTEVTRYDITNTPELADPVTLHCVGGGVSLYF